MSGGALVRAKLVPQGGDGGKPLALHYNPATLTMRTGATWQRRPTRGAKNSPEPEFTGAKPVTYIMDIVLDSVDDPGRSVPDALVQLVTWTRSTATSREADVPSPPLLVLEWGGRSWGPLHIDRLKVDHTMFAPDGTPVRAKVNLRMTEHTLEPGRTNPTSGGPVGRKRAVVAGADDLAAVAQREYGDPGLWRAVADANGIDDPGRIPRGTALLLPPIADAREAVRAGRG